MSFIPYSLNSIEPAAYTETSLPKLKKLDNGRVARVETPDETHYKIILQQIDSYLTSPFNSSYKKQRLLELYLQIKNRNYRAAFGLALNYAVDKKFCQSNFFSKQPSNALKIVNNYIAWRLDYKNMDNHCSDFKVKFPPNSIIHNTPLSHLPYTYIDATGYSNGYLFIKIASSATQYIYLVDCRKTHLNIVFADKDILVTHLLHRDKCPNGLKPSFVSEQRQYHSLTELKYLNKPIEPLLLFSSTLEFAERTNLKSLSINSQYLSPNLRSNKLMPTIISRVSNEFKRHHPSFSMAFALGITPEALDEYYQRQISDNHSIDLALPNPEMVFFKTFFITHRNLNMGKVFPKQTNLNLAADFHTSFSNNDIDAFRNILKKLFTINFQGVWLGKVKKYTALEAYKEKFQIFKTEYMNNTLISSPIKENIKTMQQFYTLGYLANIFMLTSIENIFQHCVQCHREWGHGNTQSQEYFECVMFSSFLECNYAMLEQPTKIEDLNVPQWLEELCGK